MHLRGPHEDLDTDPLGPGLLAIGIGLVVEADDYQLLDKGFVYDALYAWCRLETIKQHPSVSWLCGNDNPPGEDSMAAERDVRSPWVGQR